MSLLFLFFLDDILFFLLPPFYCLFSIDFKSLSTIHFPFLITINFPISMSIFFIQFSVLPILFPLYSSFSSCTLSLFLLISPSSSLSPFSLHLFFPSFFELPNARYCKRTLSYIAGVATYQACQPRRMSGIICILQRANLKISCFSNDYDISG